MLQRPFDGQGQGARWQVSLQQRQRLDVHLCQPFAITNMEMRWIVIVPIHRHHQTVKSADFRHARQNDQRVPLPQDGFRFRRISRVENVGLWETTHRQSVCGRSSKW